MFKLYKHKETGDVLRGSRIEKITNRKDGCYFLSMEDGDKIGISSQTLAKYNINIGVYFLRCEAYDTYVTEKDLQNDYDILHPDSPEDVENLGAPMLPPVSEGMGAAFEESLVKANAAKSKFTEEQIRRGQEQLDEYEKQFFNKFPFSTDNLPALNLVVDRLLDILTRLENTNILVTDTMARINGPFPPVNDVGDPVSPAGTIPRINGIIDTIEIRCNRLQEGVREISKI